MKRITSWILSRFISEPHDPENQAFRTKVGLLEGWLTTVANVLLFVVKVVLGIMTGSVSLLADSAHTLSDAVTSIVIIVGFTVANKPPDERHPFGHGRMESIAGVVIAVLLGVVAIEAFLSSLDRIANPKIANANVWIIIAVFGTLVAKELMARFCFDLGRMIKSPAIMADAWHTRSDVFATALVIVAFIGAHWNLTWLDGAMGIGVALIIAWAAYESMRNAIDPLLGERAPDETYLEIERIAQEVAGVDGVHDILVHRYGPLYLISLHIQVRADQPALELHAMCDKIEARVSGKFPGHTIVHPDPVDTGHKHYAEVKQAVEQEIAADPRIVSFHDLRLSGKRKHLSISFDIAVRNEKEPFHADELRARIAKRLGERFPNVEIAVDLEPPYLRNVAAEKPAAGAGG